MLHEIEPKQFEIEYCARRPKATDFFVGCQGNKIFVKCENPLSFPRIEEIESLVEFKHLQYLFSISGVGYYTYFSEIDLKENMGEYVLLRDLRPLHPMYQVFAGSVSHQLWNWYMTHQFCGKCGAKSEHSNSERAMVCPKCGTTMYPQISPSVIIGLKKENSLLLTKYQPTHSAYQNYALLAGYIETGESPEDTVRREVMEEVGLQVKNIRYFSSQPWPFSGALLLGYFCELDGEDQIVLEENELREATWVERKDIPERANDVSLTSTMMEHFRKGGE